MGMIKSLLRRLGGGEQGTKEPSMLNAGDNAPDFEAKSHDGSSVRLSDFRGKKVILWFYPKADTPG